MENAYRNPEQSEDFLSETAFRLQQASAGKRFLNYLIDVVFFYILWAVFIFVYASVFPYSYLNFYESTKGAPMTILSICSYVLVMWLLEWLLKGKTIGKYCTQTRAVYEDGGRITAKTAFMRTISRCIPFEPFSAFNAYPWHDSLTATYVIDEKASVLG